MKRKYLGAGGEQNVKSHSLLPITDNVALEKSMC